MFSVWFFSSRQIIFSSKEVFREVFSMAMLAGIV